MNNETQKQNNQPGYSPWLQPTAPTCVPEPMSQFSSDYPWATRPKCEPLTAPATSVQPATGTPRTEQLRYRIRLHVHDLNKGTTTQEECLDGIWADLSDIEDLERELAEANKTADEQAQIIGRACSQNADFIKEITSLRTRLAETQSAHDAALSTIRGMEMEEEKLRNRLALADELAGALQSIIDGCVHPEKAVRRVSVDLAPIRAVLDRYRAATAPTEDKEKQAALHFVKCCRNLVNGSPWDLTDSPQSFIDNVRSFVSGFDSVVAPTTATKGEGV